MDYTTLQNTLTTAFNTVAIVGLITLSIAFLSSAYSRFKTSGNASIITSEDLAPLEDVKADMDDYFNNETVMPTVKNEPVTVVSNRTVDDFTIRQLKAIAKGIVTGYSRMTKNELFTALSDRALV